MNSLTSKFKRFLKAMLKLSMKEMIPKDYLKLPEERCICLKNKLIRHMKNSIK